MECEDFRTYLYYIEFMYQGQPVTRTMRNGEEFTYQPWETGGNTYKSKRLALHFLRQAKSRADVVFVDFWRAKSELCPRFAMEPRTVLPQQMELYHEYMQGEYPKRFYEELYGKKYIVPDYPYTYAYDIVDAPYERHYWGHKAKIVISSNSPETGPFYQSVFAYVDVKKHNYDIGSWSYFKRRADAEAKALLWFQQGFGDTLLTEEETIEAIFQWWQFDNLFDLDTTFNTSYLAVPSINIAIHRAECVMKDLQRSGIDSAAIHGIMVNRLATKKAESFAWLLTGKEA